ncbi:snurportin-1 [Culicoides brevitarsis]|uniref:snurportin-1 n=1 Tax=Culicoides brevitarsis TaxID=469753 RepID=UPI00307C219B
MTTNTAELYKNSLRAEMMQIERRHRLLEQQRLQRNTNLDKHRKIIQNLRLHQQNFHRPNYQRRAYRNVLQFSEWMHERPDDLENWFVLPCPKGVRCLLVAEGGRTEAIGKWGNLLLTFQSMLPGGSTGEGNHRGDTTIIDAFFDKEEGHFIAIDVLAYGNQDFMNCDCEFRFYWLNTKIQEDNLGKGTKRKFPIKSVPYASFQDPLAVDELLGRFPAFPGNKPKLDGLLFYHKESLYKSGKTPLVLWLFPFMVPEVLNLHSVHEAYMSQKPSHYEGYKQYIAEFDAKQAKKVDQRTQRREQRKSTKMDCQDESQSTSKESEEKPEEEEIETRDKIDQEMFLLECEIEDTLDKSMQ